MKIVAVVFALLFCSVSFAQKEISLDSVKQNIGAYVKVCAKVYGVKELDKISFLNIGAAYPNAPLTVVIFTDDKKKFKTALKKYDGKEVCITGNVTLYKGSYQIKVEEESQLAIVVNE